jgi:hypothetical protein
MNQHKFFTFMIVLSLLLLTLGQASVPRHVSAQTEEPPLVDQTIGLEPQTDGVESLIEVPYFGTQGFNRVLDTFNRADGPLGSAWTTRNDSCSISDHTATCGYYGLATYNPFAGLGDSAEMDVAAVGTDVQYAALVLNYGAGVSNLFLKVQQQNSTGAFNFAACYTGNNEGAFGLGFFALTSSFVTAHMKAMRIGDSVTLKFTNIDGGSQPDQVYTCNGAPAREGTGIGIAGLNNVSRMDNFGVDTGKVYLTSLEIGNNLFAAYDPSLGSWTELNHFETGCQLAVGSDGLLYAHEYTTNKIVKYNPVSDSWTEVMPGPAGFSGNYCNLEVTINGQFLLTSYYSTTLWYSTGPSIWSSTTLPFYENAMGDYDSTTGQYVIGQKQTTNAHLINLETWGITDFTSSIFNGEYARVSSILDGKYYFEAGGNNIHYFDLSNPLASPVDTGINGPWYGSSAADRDNRLIYLADIDANPFWVYNPAANTLTTLPPYPNSANIWLSSIAYAWYYTDLQVDPLEIESEQCQNCLRSQSLHVCNLGNIPAEWNLSEELKNVFFTQGDLFVPVNVSAKGTGNSGQLSFSSPSTTPKVEPEKASPEASVLWDQPLSTINTYAYIDQDFPDLPTYSSFLADDFVNPTGWELKKIYIPGDFFSGGSSFTPATGLTFQIYADNAGIPAGDPSGGGIPPVWTLTLPPTDPQLTYSMGSSGFPSNVTLTLSSPVNVPAGHWWLVFYPTMTFSAGGQYGRQPADTTNGYTTQFINPGNGFGFGATWQSWSVIGPAQQDMAFRLEGSLIDIPWLSEQPTSGTLEPGDCQGIQVTLDSHGMNPGIYQGRLVLHSNDPLQAVVEVNVQMQVNGCVYLPLLTK